VMTLLVPVVASLIAWAALGEALDAVQIGAIVAVVGALAIVVLSQQQPTPVTPPQAPLTSGVDAD
jgi:drug/metabolite transporter (DMT)-like permease